MHPAILAAPMGTPILALAYNPKFDGFFALLGREDQVVPVSELVRGGDPALLVERATRAWTAGPIEPLRIAMLQQQMAAFNRELLNSVRRRRIGASGTADLPLEAAGSVGDQGHRVAAGS